MNWRKFAIGFGLEANPSTLVRITHNTCHLSLKAQLTMEMSEFSVS